MISENQERLLNHGSGTAMDLACRQTIQARLEVSRIKYNIKATEGKHSADASGSQEERKRDLMGCCEHSPAESTTQAKPPMCNTDR